MGLQRYLGANVLYGRKRSRLSGPHDPLKPEIKEYNMLSEVDREGYSSVDIYPWLPTHIEDASGNPLGAYTLMPLMMPLVGPGDHQRIGKSIFLRGIQIRGYIEVRDNLCFPCNWRLVLYRQKSIVGQGIPDYADIYKNYENFDVESSNFGTLSHYRHNFYKAMYNNEWNDVGTRQVLAKGRLVPRLDDPRTGQISQSRSVGASGNQVTVQTTDREIQGIAVAYEPIKKIVKCNLNMSATEDFLYLYLETDYPVGCKPASAKSLSDLPNPVEAMNASFSINNYPFKFNIFVRGYFCDP